MDLISVLGSKLTSFLCGRLILTWFLCTGRKLRVFRVDIEIDVVFVCVAEIDLISV